MQRVAHRTNVYQGTRQERTNTVQLNSEATFNFAVDNTGNSFSVFVSFFQRDPSFVTFSFLTDSRVSPKPSSTASRATSTSSPTWISSSPWAFLNCSAGMADSDSDRVNQYYVFVDSNNNTTNDGTRAGFDFF
ncbi:Uncharacterised protein [Klebsiella pneumoniae]|uniref:Uncharacterized protein n=1 Tax=Klebsiella pneumoniae TaxID=573 RepID=A0A2X3ER01_KLEPN|nr:Uncharacterised protein [Klebsiella pneumoniae]